MEDLEAKRTELCVQMCEGIATENLTPGGLVQMVMTYSEIRAQALRVREAMMWLLADATAIYQYHQEPEDESFNNAREALDILNKLDLRRLLDLYRASASVKVENGQPTEVKQ